MLMRTATGVPPATALVGHVKGDTACNVSPASQAGSSWERSACSSAEKDFMRKTPRSGVRGATGAARPAGAQGPQIACPAIHSSFSSDPRASVTAPAPSITMQSKAQRPVRDATQLVINAKDKQHWIVYPVCGVTTWWEESAPRTVLWGSTEWERGKNLTVENAMRAA